MSNIQQYHSGEQHQQQQQQYPAMSYSGGGGAVANDGGYVSQHQQHQQHPTQPVPIYQSSPSIVSGAGGGGGGEFEENSVLPLPPTPMVAQSYPHYHIQQQQPHQRHQQLLTPMAAVVEPPLSSPEPSPSAVNSAATSAAAVTAGRRASKPRSSGPTRNGINNSRPLSQAQIAAAADLERRTAENTYPDRLLHSCDNCRRKKIKCDGNKEPGCGTCVRLGHSCHYSTVLKRQRKKRQPNAYGSHHGSSISTRIGNMEQLLLHHPQSQSPEHIANMESVEITSITTGSKHMHSPLGSDNDDDDDDGEGWTHSSPWDSHKRYKHDGNDQHDQHDHYANAECTDRAARNSRSSLVPSAMTIPDSLPRVWGDQLPEEHIVNELIDLYFERFPPHMLVIDRTWFMARYQNKSLPLYLLYSMMAYSARYSTHQLIRHEPAHLSGREFADIAQRLVTPAMLTPNIVTIKTLLNLSLYEYGAACGERSWMFMGMSMRMAQQLMLNRTDDPDLALVLGTTATWQEHETRRRVWWACFIKDKVASVSTARPAAVQDEDCEVLLPSNDHSWASGEPPGPDLPPLEANDSAYMFVRMYSLLGHVGQFVNRRKLRRTPAIPEFREIDTELRVYYAGLPPELLIDVTAPLTSEQISTPRQCVRLAEVVYLHLLFHGTLILLHRSNIAFRSSESLDSSLIADARQTCLQAAHRMMKILRWAEPIPPESFNFFVGFAIVQAGIIFVNHVQSPDYAQAADSYEQLEYLWFILGRLSSQCAFSAHIIPVLQEIYRCNRDARIIAQKQKHSASNGNEAKKSESIHNDSEQWFLPTRTSFHGLLYRLSGTLRPEGADDATPAEPTPQADRRPSHPLHQSVTAADITVKKEDVATSTTPDMHQHQLDDQPQQGSEWAPITAIRPTPPQSATLQTAVNELARSEPPPSATTPGGDQHNDLDNAQLPPASATSTNNAFGDSSSIHHHSVGDSSGSSMHRSDIGTPSLSMRSEMTSPVLDNSAEHIVRLKRLRYNLTIAERFHQEQREEMSRLRSHLNTRSNSAHLSSSSDSPANSPHNTDVVLGRRATANVASNIRSSASATATATAAAPASSKATLITPPVSTEVVAQAVASSLQHTQGQHLRPPSWPTVPLLSGLDHLNKLQTPQQQQQIHQRHQQHMQVPTTAGVAAALPADFFAQMIQGQSAQAKQITGQMSSTAAAAAAVSQDVPIALGTIGSPMTTSAGLDNLAFPLQMDGLLAATNPITAMLNQSRNLQCAVSSSGNVSTTATDAQSDAAANGTLSSLLFQPATSGLPNLASTLPQQPVSASTTLSNAMAPFSSLSLASNPLTSQTATTTAATVAATGASLDAGSSLFNASMLLDPSFEGLFRDFLF